MKLFRMLSCVLGFLVICCTVSAQTEQWLVALADDEAIEDVAALNDGTIVALIATYGEADEATSRIVRYQVGEALPEQLATLSGLRLNRIEALDGEMSTFLVGGASGDQLVHRLCRVENGNVEVLWDMDDIVFPSDREQSFLRVSRDAKHWAAYWPGEPLMSLHVVVGEVPNGKPLMTVDLELDPGDMDEAMAAGVDPIMEWPDFSRDIALLDPVEGKPTVAATWWGSTQIIRSSDRVASAVLRPTLHGGISLQWSPSTQTLWVGGFHGWSAFDVTDPSMFGGEAILSPQLEIPQDHLETCDASTLREREDGTILLADSFGRQCLLYRRAPSGEPKLVASYDLELGIFPAKVSQSGRFIAGRVQAPIGEPDPKTIVRQEIPLLEVDE